MRRVYLTFIITFSQCIVVYQAERNQKEENGGWLTLEEDRIAQPGPCNIDRIDLSSQKFTQQHFLDNYAFNKPFVIAGATDNQNFQSLCEKRNLLERYGKHTVRLSSANTYSYDKRDVALTKYIDEIMKAQTLDRYGNETFYWFGDNDHEAFEDLFNMYNPPPYQIPNLTGMYSFGVAAAGTGVPFHFHGAGFAEVIFGRKRWFMYPPEKQPAFNPNKTTLHWLEEEYPNLHESDMPLECTIDQGEAIYFPDRWWHGTLNIDTSVFISTFLG